MRSTSTRARRSTSSRTRAATRSRLPSGMTAGSVRVNTDRAAPRPPRTTAIRARTGAGPMAGTSGSSITSAPERTPVALPSSAMVIGLGRVTVRLARDERPEKRALSYRLPPHQKARPPRRDAHCNPANPANPATPATRRTRNPARHSVHGGAEPAQRPGPPQAPRRARVPAGLRLRPAAGRHGRGHGGPLRQGRGPRDRARAVRGEAPGHALGLHERLLLPGVPEDQRPLQARGGAPHRAPRPGAAQAAAARAPRRTAAPSTAWRSQLDGSQGPHGLPHRPSRLRRAASAAGSAAGGGDRGGMDRSDGRRRHRRARRQPSRSTSRAQARGAAHPRRRPRPWRRSGDRGGGARASHRGSRSRAPRRRRRAAGASAHGVDAWLPEPMPPGTEDHRVPHAGAAEQRSASRCSIPRRARRSRRPRSSSSRRRSRRPIATRSASSLASRTTARGASAPRCAARTPPISCRS